MISFKLRINIMTTKVLFTFFCNMYKRYQKDIEQDLAQPSLNSEPCTVFGKHDRLLINVWKYLAILELR